MGRREILLKDLFSFADREKREHIASVIIDDDDFDGQLFDERKRVKIVKKG